jgi:aryl-alcohol dehydrogenase-like predicted oxidoreductase
MNAEMPYRPLGSTGEMVSIIGLGGHHIGTQADEKESIAIIRTAIDSGINFMDNSWGYNGGQSEIRMGKALRDGYRSKVFLMTKVDGRDKKTAQNQIDDSLRRLKTDVIDLIQFHEIIRMSDPDRIFAPDGAMEAFKDARKAGKIRYIGFTGHKHPDIHLKMLRMASDNAIRFDTVQMPLNVMDAHYKSFEKNILPRLLDEKIGVLGMKPMGDQVILSSRAVTAGECLRYAMSLPVSVVITGCDSLPILKQALEAARTFKPLIGEDRSLLLEKTRKFALEGKYEHYKTTHEFDSTEFHSEWLG